MSHTPNDRVDQAAHRRRLASSVRRWATTRRAVFATCALLVCDGCAAPANESSRAAHTAWGNRNGSSVNTQPATAARTVPTDLMTPTGVGEGDDVIAYVNGEPISRDRVVDLLIAGHGVGILEQIVVLERAKRMAAESNIYVGPADVAREYDLRLQALLGQLAPADDSADFDREAAERILESVLARRNVSMAEYRLGVSRNAHLRAIVEANTQFTDAQLEEEFRRMFGRRADVRHIQVAGMADAERVLRRLQAGEDFSVLATRYSANLSTAPDGGRLRTFSDQDPDVPPAVRDAAFRLAPGETSNPIRVDEWYHVIRVDAHYPPSDANWQDARIQLTASLRRRLTDPAMQTLYRALFEQADIRISDPVLEREFSRKHPEHGRRPRAGGDIPAGGR